MPASTSLIPQGRFDGYTIITYASPGKGPVIMTLKALAPLPHSPVGEIFAVGAEVRQGSRQLAQFFGVARQPLTRAINRYPADMTQHVTWSANAPNLRTNKELVGAFALFWHGVWQANKAALGLQCGIEMPQGHFHIITDGATPHDGALLWAASERLRGNTSADVYAMRHPASILTLPGVLFGAGFQPGLMEMHPSSPLGQARMMADIVTQARHNSPILGNFRLRA